MSTYLNFYILPRKSKDSSDEPKPMSLVSFSGSSDLSFTISDYTRIASSYNDENKYTELTPELLQGIIDSLKKDIEKRQNRLLTTYKILPPADRFEQMNEIISDEEYLDEMRANLVRLNLIKDIADDIANGYTAFEKLLCNIR